MNVTEYKFLNETKFEVVLENGLTVIVIPKKGFLKYFASFSTSFGAFDTEYVSINKKEKVRIPNGVAHFLEHKMFEMENGLDATEYFSNLGVDSNAFTDYNQTSYIISGTSNLEEAVLYLLDFVQSPYFTEENVRKEKGIIIQEYKMYQDQPNEILNDRLMKNMYANISYNEDIVGNENEINSISCEILQDAYDTFYHPSNMIFTLVADVDPVRIINLISENQRNKTFKKNFNLERIAIKEQDNIIKEEEILYKDVTMPKVALGIKFPFENYEGINSLHLEIKLKIFLELYIGSMSDSFQEMLDNEFIGNNFRYNIRIDSNSAFIKIVTDSKKPQEFINYLFDKFKKIDNFVINKESFDIIKKAFWGSVLMSLNDVEYIGISYPEYFLKKCDLFDAIEKIKNIEYTDINEVKKYFDIKKISKIIMYKERDS